MKILSFSQRVGLRYLLSPRKSSFLSILTIMSVSGVFVGVFTLIVIMSVMAGFEMELKKRLFTAETHIVVQKQLGLISLKDEKEVLEKLEGHKPHLFTDVDPVLQAEVILRSGKKSAGAMLKGSLDEKLKWVRSHVVEWAPQDLLRDCGLPSVFVGSEMALQLAVIPGDRISVVSPLEKEGPFGVVPKIKRFVVEGIYQTNVPEQELYTVFTDFNSLEQFLDVKDQASAIELRIKDLEQAESVAAKIKSSISNNSYLVRSWQELNQHLFRSLKLEQKAMFVILLFIIIVATFNVTTTLTMMVIEKKRSLSILQTMGASKEQISKIFSWVAFGIGGLGIVFGVLLGLLTCFILSRWSFLELPEFYYDRTIPVLVQPWSIVGIIGSAAAIVWLGTFLPVRKSLHITPIQGLKDG